MTQPLQLWQFAHTAALVDLSVLARTIETILDDRDAEMRWADDGGNPLDA